MNKKYRLLGEVVILKASLTRYWSRKDFVSLGRRGVTSDSSRNNDSFTKSFFSKKINWPPFNPLKIFLSGIKVRVYSNNW